MPIDSVYCPSPPPGGERPPRPRRWTRLALSVCPSSHSSTIQASGQLDRGGDSTPDGGCQNPGVEDLHDRRVLQPGAGRRRRCARRRHRTSRYGRPTMECPRLAGGASAGNTCVQVVPSQSHVSPSGLPGMSLLSPPKSRTPPAKDAIACSSRGDGAASGCCSVHCTPFHVHVALLFS